MASRSSNMAEAESGLSDYSDSESDCEFQSDCTERNPVLTLLDKLKSPKPSELAWKRKSNPPKGKRKSSGSNALKCKLKARPATRINEFPNEHLIVSFGKLFCSVCRGTHAVEEYCS